MLIPHEKASSPIPSSSVLVGAGMFSLLGDRMEGLERILDPYMSPFDGQLEPTGDDAVGLVEEGVEAPLNCARDPYGG